MSPKVFDLAGFRSGGSRVLGSAPPPPPPPPPPDQVGGTPYGSADCWTSSPAALKSNTSPFTFSKDSETPTRLLSHILAARPVGKKLVPALTGGGHERYLNAGDFDIEYWKHGNPAISGTGMDQYDTPQIVDAVGQAVDEGTILGFDMIDEPQAADWGGGITKTDINNMALYLKGIFPSAAAGLSVRSDYRQGAPGNPNYTDVDFIISQWIQGFEVGANGLLVHQWRDARLADANTNGVKMVFSLNVLNGGSTISGVTACPIPPTGGWSPSSPTSRCAMGTGSTAAYPGGQVEFYGIELMDPHPTFGNKAVGLFQWRYDAAFYARTENKASFAALAAFLATRPSQSWYR